MLFGACTFFLIAALPSLVLPFEIVSVLTATTDVVLVERIFVRDFLDKLLSWRLMTGRSGLFDFSFFTATAVALVVLMYLTSLIDAVVVVRAFKSFGPAASVDVASTLALLEIVADFIELLRVIGFVQCVSTRGFTFFKSIMPDTGIFSFSMFTVTPFFVGSATAAFGFGARFTKSPNAGRRVCPSAAFFAAKTPMWLNCEFYIFANKKNAQKK